LAASRLRIKLRICSVRSCWWPEDRELRWRILKLYVGIFKKANTYIKSRLVDGKWDGWGGLYRRLKWRGVIGGKWRCRFLRILLLHAESTKVLVMALQLWAMIARLGHGTALTSVHVALSENRCVGWKGNANQVTERGKTRATNRTSCWQPAIIKVASSIRKNWGVNAWGGRMQLGTTMMRLK
jgi:hypothetical protein